MGTSAPDNDDVTRPERCDLLIRNAVVLTMNPERLIYSPGAIAISGRTIRAVGRELDVVPRFEPVRTIDAGGAPVHPGFIDGHVHMSHVNARGAFPDTVSFEDGMRYYKDWNNSFDEEDELASAALACLEMVRNGTTCVMEAGTAIYPDQVAEVMESIGIRGLVADPWLWDNPDYPSAAEQTRTPIDRERSLSLLGQQLKRNRDPDALVRGHVSIYGIGTATDELMLAAKACADANGTTLNAHQSFAWADAEIDDQRLGKHPLVHWAEIGALGPNVLLTHMNVLRDDEIPPILESGLGITWCVTSSAIWAVGGTAHGRHDELFRRGVNVMFGSDSGNSSLRFDLTQQAVVAILTSREKRLDRRALGPAQAFEMLTIAGARAIGLDSMIGSIEPGKRADLVIRRTDIPEVQPGLDVLQGLVLSQASKSVDTVVVDGQIVVEHGHSTRVDEGAVYARMRASARKMLLRVGLDAAPEWPVVS